MADQCPPFFLLRRLAQSEGKPDTRAVAMRNRLPPSRLRMLGFLRQRQPTGAMAAPYNQKFKSPETRMDFDPKLDLQQMREIDVPAADVWRAWTQPEVLKKWFC